MNASSHVIIFGGTGFIGTHLTQHLMREQLAGKITLIDIAPPRSAPYASELQNGLLSGNVEYIEWDVRKSLPLSHMPPHADLIVNLAAIHREPGHEPCEYFETNTLGARNVCAYAASVGCQTIVFSSSISPYGPSEDARDEASLPVPETPYGNSKLLAETIHEGWQAAEPGRNLLILRPGVVFGPGEAGNVTRLVKSIVRGYFVYLGNRRTRKAGGYVKELCFVVQFGLEHLIRSGVGLIVLNFSIDPPATMQTFVEAIQAAAGIRRTPITVPRFLILSLSYIIDGAASVVQVTQPITPVRVRKMFRSTYIVPKRLRELGYEWKFSIEDSFQDWKKEVPGDFLR